ncbi:MAG TPA: DUF2922 domain-containing protein [Epulopiscium sp.]|nr:DUF2922 domain-containing protein [Candidatus Epulonipiscium sp.]
MEEPKKVLQMTFVTQEGGSLRISVGQTKETLTAEEVKAVMDTVVSSGVFKTGKGAVVGKAAARFLTQQIQKLDIV